MHVVPSVQHSFSGVVVHHGVVAVLVCELYVGVPLFFCIGVVSKVDCGGIGVIGVDTVDHSTGDESIAHRTHWFCAKNNKNEKEGKRIRKREICTVNFSWTQSYLLCPLAHKMHCFIGIVTV